MKAYEDYKYVLKPQSWNGPTTYVNKLTSVRAIRAVSSVNNRWSRPWSNFAYQKVVNHGSLEVLKLYGHSFQPDPSGQYIVMIGETWADIPQGTAAWGTDSPSVLADQIALAKLLSRLKDARAQWQAAVSLAEARSTAAMIANAARRIVGAARALRKGRVGDAWAQVANGRAPPKGRHKRMVDKYEGYDMTPFPNAFANAWLEFSYGWRPLLSDVDAAAKYLAEKACERNYQVYPINAKHTVYQNGTYFDYFPLSNKPSTASNHCYVWENNFSVKYTYELYPDFLRKPNSLEELGFTDPLSVAWELVPFSFVADWFVNVGQVLESLHEFRQWSVKRGLRSTKNEYKRSQWLIEGPTQSSGLVNFQRAEPGLHQLTWRQLGRGVLGSLPTMVPLRIKVDNPFDLKEGQFATAISLLVQFFHPSGGKR